MATPTREPQADRPVPAEHTLRSNDSGPSGSGSRVRHEWILMGLGLTALLAVVAIIASVVSLASKSSTTTTIMRQATPTAASGASSGKSGTGSPTAAASLGSGQAQAGAAAVVPIVVQKDATTGTTGTITGRDGWPRFSPSNITIPAGKKVTLVITNYDDMNTPLTGGEPYNKVMGGTETVDSKPVTFVSNKMIAHTFTVTGLGVNVPIPMAMMGKDQGTTITFTFVAHKKGTYTWQCYTPCGSGKNGTGGPMVTPGYMTGTLTVT